MTRTQEQKEARNEERSCYALADSGEDTYLLIARKRESQKHATVTAYVFWDGELVVNPVSSWKVSNCHIRHALDLMCACLITGELNVYEARDSLVDREWAEEIAKSISPRAVYKTWALNLVD